MNRVAAIFCAGIVLLGAAVRAEEAVSRTPPAIYENQLAPLLTPFEEAVALPPATLPAGRIADFDPILRETLVRVDASFRTTTATRYIRKVLTDDGVDLLGELDRSFRPAFERLHVVEARTHRPDGTIAEVEDEGLFVRAPDVSDTEGVHSDRRTLHVVFPELQPHAILDLVLVEEEFQPLVPDFLARYTRWGTIEATRRSRLVVEIPAALEEEFRWDHHGLQLRPPARSEPEPGMVRFTWQQDAVPLISNEDGSPPLAQRGPGLYFGVQASWEAIGTWYASLLTSDAPASPPLQEAAREWAGDDPSPRALAARLYEAVRDKVRYTGLEFGLGAYQPRTPELVKQTGYGDCKDKANLLRILLGEHGIASRLVLLQTEHAGLISRRHPRPGAFNHAILAIDFPDADSPVFCDPTAPDLPFGMLPPHDSDREVLLIGEDGAIEWVRTPPAHPAVLDFHFDLQPEPGGGLSGWITFAARGVLGVRLRAAFREKAFADQLALLRRSPFIALPGSQPIDFELIDPSGPDDPPFRIRVYCLRRGADLGEAGLRERLPFPGAAYLLPAVGEEETRLTPLYSSPRSLSVNGTFRLPAGWTVLDVPTALETSLPNLESHATWLEEDGALKCRGLLRSETSLLPPREHPARWQWRRDLLNWFQNPVLLKREAEDSDGRIVEGSWTPDPSTLPALCTPEGQQLLINTRFPLDLEFLFDTDVDARRTGFRQLKALFPDDRSAQFDAELNLLFCDLIDSDEYERLLQDTRDLVAAYRDELTVPQLAAGEIMIALALYQKDQYEEAARIAVRLAEDERNLPEARAGAALLACEVLAAHDPARSVAFAEQGLTLPNAPSLTIDEVGTYWMFGTARLAKDSGEDLLATTRAFLDRQTTAERREMLRDSFLWAPEMLIDHGHPDPGRAVLAVLQSFADEDPVWREENEWIFENLEPLPAALDTVTPLHARLVAWLAAHPWPDFTKVADGTRIESATTALAAVGDSDPERDLRYQLRALVSYGPQPLFADYAQHAAELTEQWIVARTRRSAKSPAPPVDLEALLDLLLATWAEAPEGEIFDREDAARMRGTVVLRRDGEEAALTYYRSLAVDEELSLSLRRTAWREVASIHRARDEVPEVLAAWDQADALDDDLDHDYLLLGIYLCLQSGLREEGWMRLARLARIPPDEREIVFASDEVVAELTGFVADRSGTEQWWDAAAIWWPQWESLARDLAIPSSAKRRGALPMSVIDEWDENLRKALRKKNPKRRRNAFKTLLADTLEMARWHPSLAPPALELLETHAPAVYPKRLSDFASLAKALRTVHAIPELPQNK